MKETKRMLNKVLSVSETFAILLVYLNLFEFTLVKLHLGVVFLTNAYSLNFVYNNFSEFSRIYKQEFNKNKLDVSTYKCVKLMKNPEYFMYVTGICENAINFLMALCYLQHSDSVYVQVHSILMLVRAKYM